MLVVETIAKIGRAHLGQGKSIGGICRDLKVSRHTVCKVIRSGDTGLVHGRSHQPHPGIGPWRDHLEGMLAENATRSRKERLAPVLTCEALRNRGHDGSHDAVRRHAARWHEARQRASADAHVPLSLDPGDAHQFDWSREVVLIDGITTTVKVAHVRLSHSRMPFARACPAETQQMVFDAHDKAFAFFGGACARGTCDNMKTAVDAIFVDRQRACDRRLQQLCGHHLVDPVARTPASGCKKGQVGNRAGVLRRRSFTPRLKLETHAGPDAWPEDRCLSHSRASRHPDLRDKSIHEVFQEGQPGPVPHVGPPDGLPTFRIATGQQMSSQQMSSQMQSTAFLPFHTSLPMVAMPVTRWHAICRTWNRDRQSRLHGGQMRQRDLSSLPGVGLSSAHSHGWVDAEGWQGIGRRPCRHPKAGHSSHQFEELHATLRR